MRNHNQKRRDMARSVLPSTFGSNARYVRRSIHKAERRHTCAVLRNAHTADEGFDDHVDYDYARSIKEFRQERRDHDKIGPLIRWATSVVRDDPTLRNATLEERLDHFRRVLPDDVIGRHAVAHLRYVLDPHRFRSSTWHTRVQAQRAERETRLRAALERIVAAGTVGELNAALKVRFPAQYVEVDGNRVFERNEAFRFHGHRDLERFLALAMSRHDVGSRVLEVDGRIDR